MSLIGLLLSLCKNNRFELILIAIFLETNKHRISANCQQVHSPFHSHTLRNRKLPLRNFFYPCCWDKCPHLIESSGQEMTFSWITENFHRAETFTQFDGFITHSIKFPNTMNSFINFCRWSRSVTFRCKLLIQFYQTKKENRKYFRLALKFNECDERKTNEFMIAIELCLLTNSKLMEPVINTATRQVSHRAPPWPTRHNCAINRKWIRRKGNK